MTGQVRPGERATVLGFSILLFGFTTGHLLLETARDALFLARLPASRLPWVYLGIAVVALVLSERATMLGGRADSRRSLLTLLRGAAVVTLSLWAALPFAGLAGYYALYVWTGVLATLFIVRFWIIASSTFTVTQAKRVYAVIGAGAVAGGIAGAAIAALIASVLPARALVLAAGFVMAATSFLPVEEAKPRGVTGSGSTPQPLRAAVRLVLDRPYLARVGAVLLLGSITFTLVDYVFKSAVDRAVEPANLDTFFALTYLAFNLLSLLVQVGLAGWLIRRLGVNRAMAFVPGLVLVSSLGVAAVGGLAMAVALKTVDGGLRNSLHRTSSELLFVPLASELRSRVKPIIDVVGQRGGQALASLGILALLTLSTSNAVFAALAAVAATVWLMLSLDLRRHYLDVFRTSLNDEITAARWELPALDIGGIESLVEGFDDRDDRRVLAALDLAAAYGRANLVPSLLLRSGSEPVIIRTMETFAHACRKETAPAVAPLTGHPSPAVRAAAIRTLVVLGAGDESSWSGLTDPSAVVRAAALVGLQGDRLPPEGADAASVQAVALSGSGQERLELARGMRANPRPEWGGILLGMLAVEDSAIRSEATHALGAIGVEEAAPHLLAALSDRGLRAASRGALVALGPEMLSRLERELADATTAHDIRRQLPAVIAAFGTAPAADILVDQLGDETDGMIRFKILRALGHMRHRQPALPLDRRALRRERDRALATATRFMVLRRALDHDRSGDDHARRLLSSLLRDKETHALERVFRLYNLETGNEDFFRVFRGLQSQRRELRAGGIELLEHLLDQEEAARLIRLVDDLDEVKDPGNEKLDAAMSEAMLETVLGELVEGPSASIRELASAYVLTRPGEVVA